MPDGHRDAFAADTHYVADQDSLERRRLLDQLHYLDLLQRLHGESFAIIAAINITAIVNTMIGILIFANLPSRWIMERRSRNSAPTPDGFQTPRPSLSLRRSLRAARSVRRRSSRGVLRAPERGP